MAYIDLADLKTYLGSNDATDDALLSTLIRSAQSQIDRHCGRTFEALTDSTRYFRARSVRGQTLGIDEDLVSVTSLVDANGDVIPPSDYWLLPRNETPKCAIELKFRRVWQIGDPDAEIAVTGRWAFSIIAPDDVQQATRRLAAYLYRQKDAQVFDATATAEMGQMVIPKGIPADVKLMLAPYRRLML